MQDSARVPAPLARRGLARRGGRRARQPVLEPVEADVPAGGVARGLLALAEHAGEVQQAALAARNADAASPLPDRSSE